MGRQQIAVVGAGLKAPGGNTVEALWQALSTGRPTAQRFLDERLPANSQVLRCEVAGFEPSAYLTPVEVRRLDRCHHLAIGAAQDALDTVTGRALPSPQRCAVVCGVGFGATATYEEQHARLLTQGLKALSPLSIPIVMPSS